MDAAATGVESRLRGEEGVHVLSTEDYPADLGGAVGPFGASRDKETTKPRPRNTATAFDPLLQNRLRGSPVAPTKRCFFPSTPTGTPRVPAADLLPALCKLRDRLLHVHNGARALDVSPPAASPN